MNRLTYVELLNQNLKQKPVFKHTHIFAILMSYAFMHNDNLC